MSETNDKHDIQTGGGAYIPGRVDTGGGAFAGRDLHIHGDQVVLEAAQRAQSLHQIPSPPADFTGREEKLAELRTAITEGGVMISGVRGMGGVAKTASGLLKLVYPHRTADDLTRDELAPCLDLAAECRERVIEQLAVMAPGEFQPVRFELM